MNDKGPTAITYKSEYFVQLHRLDVGHLCPEEWLGLIELRTIPLEVVTHILVLRLLLPKVVALRRLRLGNILNKLDDASLAQLDAGLDLVFVLVLLQ